MKTDMSAAGVITITPETGAEAFALQMWQQRAALDMPIPGLALSAVMRTKPVWDPQYLVVYFDRPKVPTC